MIFTKKKEESYTIKEFLRTATHKETISRAHPPLKAYSFMGINITHHSFFSASFVNGAYYMVFAVFGVAMLSVLAEYIYRKNGNEVAADAISAFTKALFPVSFYLFLYFGITSTF